MSNIKKATLTVNLEYSGDSDTYMIEHLLRKLVSRGASDGMLDGYGEVSILSWDCDVRVIQNEPGQ